MVDLWRSDCEYLLKPVLYVCRINHVKDHIVERTSLPDHLIRGVGGQVAFSETQQRVGPYICVYS